VARPRQTHDRQKTRVTKVLPVDCRILELPAPSSKNLVTTGQVFGGRTINLSEDGLLVNTDYFLDPKTRLEVVFKLGEGPSRKTIKVQAEVARCQKNAFNLYGRWALGLHVVQPPREFSILTDHFS
jgi:hypothetical protein